MKFWPQMACAIHVKHTLPVRLRSTPLNNSLHLVPADISQGTRTKSA
jgi:hypothetical protein